MENASPHGTNYISIGWWNTSLRPAGRERSIGTEAKTRLLNVAACSIHNLLEEQHLDCLALGEVTRDALDEISGLVDLSEFETIASPKSTGRTSFDTAVIFRRSKLKQMSNRVLVGMRGANQIRLAHLFVFQSNDEELIHVFVVHWASRLWMPEGDPRRNAAGNKLKLSLIHI